MKIGAACCLLLVIPLAGCVAQNAADTYAKRIEERRRMVANQPSYLLKFDVSLAEVQRPPEAASRFGEISTSQIDTGSGLVFKAEDQIVQMYWSGPAHELAFELVNRSDSPIKVLWDEAAYVDISGHSLRVIHNGVKLAERNSAQTPSIVAGKGKLSDMVFPSENVSFSTGQYTGGWHQRPMFPCTRKGYYCADAEKLAQMYTGSTYRVLLPVQVGKETYPYTFVFNVKRAEVVTLTKGDDAINTKGAGQAK